MPEISQEWVHCRGSVIIYLKKIKERKKKRTKKNVYLFLNIYILKWFGGIAKIIIYFEIITNNTLLNISKNKSLYCLN